jgi:hypothetical protein
VTRKAEETARFSHFKIFAALDSRVGNRDVMFLVADGETEFSFECRLIETGKDFPSVSRSGECRCHVSEGRAEQKVQLNQDEIRSRGFSLDVQPLVVTAAI